MGASSTNGWRQCPDGEFSSLAGRLTARRQRRLALSVALGIGVAALVGAVGAAVTEHIIDSVSASSHGCCPSQHPPVCDPPSSAPAAR
jgi:hypothetical protein